jgi:hypothetical protein
MKKIMIAVAIACVAALANAASCTWSTSVLTQDQMNMVSGGSYWVVALGSTGTTDAFQVFSDGSYDFGSYTVVGSGTTSTDGSGSAGGKITGLSASDNGNKYAFIVWDGAADGYYGIAEGTIAGIVDTPPTDAKAIGFDNTGFGGYTAVNTSVVAVPEPTSGLLMLVGLAGLALRRRRA